MKLRLFLVDAGLIDQVDVRLYEQDSEGLREIRAALSKHMPKVGFPTAELRPGEFKAESDELIAWFAGSGAVDPAALPTYQDFVTGMFSGHLRLFRENLQLKNG
jgi:hypothetical protein